MTPLPFAALPAANPWSSPFVGSRLCKTHRVVNECRHSLDLMVDRIQGVDGFPTRLDALVVGLMPSLAVPMRTFYKGEGLSLSGEPSASVRETWDRKLSQALRLFAGELPNCRRMALRLRLPLAAVIDVVLEGRYRICPVGAAANPPQQDVASNSDPSKE